MPVILIVDDSDVDQRLVAGMIKQDIEWIVEVADNGESALELIESIFPDVVITDLMMPKMDGIELVQQVKTRHPQVPVILMTSKGSEELAVRALEAGAASYVPKSALADCLMDTIEQVLQMADRAKSQQRLRQCRTSSRFRFELTNDPDLIPPLIRFVNDELAKHEFGQEAVRRQAGVALQEALINAMFHGNLELSPSEVQMARREMHLGKTSALVQERSQQQPFNQRRIIVHVDIIPPSAQFTVRDQGSGFDIKELPPIEDLDSLSSGKVGRGLTLIGHLMDEIEFNETGNQIRMALSFSNNGRL